MGRTTAASYSLALALMLALAFTTTIFMEPQHALSQGSGGTITGYAWSDTIGWISMSGATYGLVVDDSGGISGYAWSDNVGWVSADASDLSGCPSSPCTARFEEGEMQGWLRALSGGTAESGGWDGFISLGGSGYGVGQSGSSLSGYAWGDVNVGWVDFAHASTTYEACVLTQGYFCDAGVSKHRDSQCVVTTNQVCSYLCAEDAGICVPPPAPAFEVGGTLRAEPRLVSHGNPVKVSWEVAHADSCTVSENNPAITDSWTGVASQGATCTPFGNGCLSSAISQQTTYTLSCAGEGGTLVESVTVTLNPNWQER